MVDKVEVEPASGSLGIRIPLGPGIAVKNLHFQPTLVGQYHPQAQRVKTVNYTTRCPQPGNQCYVDGVYYSEWFNVSNIGGFGFQTGGITIPLGDPEAESEWADLIGTWVNNNSFAPVAAAKLRKPSEQVSSFALPDGTSGTILSLDTLISNKSNNYSGAPSLDESGVISLIGKFGFNNSWNISKIPYTETNGNFYPNNPGKMVKYGSGGEIVIGIVQSNIIQEYQIGIAFDSTTSLSFPMSHATPKSSGGSSNSRCVVPQTILIIKNDILYEFHLKKVNYGPAVDNRVQFIRSVAYQIKTMRNMYGDKIVFNAPPLIDYFSVQNNISECIDARIESNGEPLYPAVKFQDNKIKYSTSNGDSVLYDIDYSILGETGAYGLKINHIENLITKEKFVFKYKVENFSVGGNGTVLSEIQNGQKITKLSWGKYQYLRTRDENGEWSGLLIDNPPANPPVSNDSRMIMPCEAMGVTSVAEIVGDYSRITNYDRVVPTVNLQSPTQWKSTDFYCVITNPDRSKSKLFFVKPLMNKLIGANRQEDLQLLAYNKHLLQKIEKYDHENNLYYTEEYPIDSLDVRTLTAPGGDIPGNSQPYFKNKIIKHFENGIIVSQVNYTKEDWDSENPGWRTEKIINVWNGEQEIKSVRKTYEWKSSLARIFTTSEQSTGKPKSEWDYDEYGRVSKLKIIPDGYQSEALCYNYAYEDPGISGFNYLNGPLPGSIKLDGANFKQSGQVGVKYGFDKLGRIARIQPFGASWVLGQTTDELGRVSSQTDANGITKSYAWDDAGRLESVSVPGEVSTVYTYDLDGLGASIVRGEQEARIRFNDFGELIREARKAGGSWSHRLFGIDLGGRKVWETGWRLNLGEDGMWTEPIGPEDRWVGGAPGHWARVCAEWAPPPGGGGGIGGNGDPLEEQPAEENPPPEILECIAWEEVWVPASGQLVAKNSTHYSYDFQGRPVAIRDPNGVTTTTAYGLGGHGPRKTVTRGIGAEASVTLFETDGFGRLRSVVNQTERGPLITSYRYDLADRILGVDQWSAASQVNGVWVGSGLRQARSWSYNALGWLEQLVQPESGTTTYSDFDVAGRPWRTSYNGRIVDSQFDPMGRVLSIKSQDDSVDNSFAYDEADHGISVGKLTSSRSGQVNKKLYYEGLSGRLSQIVRTLDGIDFIQNIEHDSYGNISKRRYPSHSAPNTLGITQVITYDFSTGAPKTSGYGSSAALMTYDPIHWGLTRVETLMGPVTALTNYTYGEDQIRLAALSHGAIVGSGMPEIPSINWVYIYDDQGRLLGDGEDRFTYDRLGRIKSAIIVDPYGSQAIFQNFSYDAFGNRIESSTASITNWTSGNPIPSTLTLGSLRPGLSSQIVNFKVAETRPELLKNQLPSTMLNGGETGASYDAQGNLLQVFPRISASGEALAMSYDALSRVSSLAYGPMGNRVIEQYLYDDEGLRIRIWDGAKYRYNIYNEARQLIAQYEKSQNGSLTWVKDIIYVGTKEMAEISSDGKTRVTLCDHLGTPRLVWDGINAPIEQKFLPFGETLHDPTTSAKFAKGFTNHEQTDPSGLIYMQARFYLPMYGRFASPDPARDQHFEETQSWNIYSYVQNNPVMKVDPTGMVAQDPLSYSLSENGDRERKLLSTQPAGTMKDGIQYVKQIWGALVNGFKIEGTAFENVDKKTGAISSCLYGKIRVGLGGLEISGGVAKTEHAPIDGNKDNPVKLETKGPEAKLNLTLVPYEDNKEKTKQDITLAPKISVEGWIFKTGAGPDAFGKTVTVGGGVGGAFSVPDSSKGLFVYRDVKDTPKPVKKENQ